ncbi:LPXTG cell wall anchor domain-containing protein [Amycolatopsis sp. cmx-11-12]|uniref:LPXTG cell wall anchor domain-containing protein n=1 Tax=Amycolatopsis sp. cmx-11-12 TaxID=2785795 RepID=UPI003917FB18
MTRNRKATSTVSRLLGRLARAVGVVAAGGALIFASPQIASADDPTAVITHALKNPNDLSGLDPFIANASKADLQQLVDNGATMAQLIPSMVKDNKLSGKPLPDGVSEADAKRNLPRVVLALQEKAKQRLAGGTAQEPAKSASPVSPKTPSGPVAQPGTSVSQGRQDLAKTGDDWLIPAGIGGFGAAVLGGAASFWFRRKAVGE